MSNDYIFDTIDEKHFYKQLVNALQDNHCQIIITASLSSILGTPLPDTDTNWCDTCFEHRTKFVLFNLEKKYFELIILLEAENFKPLCPHADNHSADLTMLCKQWELPILSLKAPVALSSPELLVLLQKNTKTTLQTQKIVPARD